CLPRNGGGRRGGAWWRLTIYRFYTRLQDDSPALKEKNVKGREQGIEQYRLKDDPYYAEINGEIGLFKAAALARMPVMLKGPTGCGKPRFVQHMAYRLGRPLITIACHEDLTASDLVGRYLLKGGETIWVDGPLTLGVKHG